MLRDTRATIDPFTDSSLTEVCYNLESLSVGDHYSDLSYLALRPILWLQPYCRIGATVLGATMDFDPYSDQGHGNHKLDHWAQLLSTSQGRIPLSMSTVHRSNEVSLALALRFGISLSGLS